MLTIKIILIIPLLAIIILALLKLKKQAFLLLFLIAISLIGILFITFPSITNTLAKSVGIGRGADLVSYIFILFFLVYGVFLYTKIKKIEENQTELVRKFSIQQAKKMDKE